MQKEKRQQGQILVEMGALSPYNLQRALVEQVEAKLLEIFAWPDGKFMFKAGEEIPAGATATRAPARRADPRGHPPPLRRGPPEGGAGALRGPVRGAQRRPDAAPAGDDRRPDRAGVHPRASTARASWRRSSRARRSRRQGAPAAGGAVRGGDDPAARGDLARRRARPSPAPLRPPAPAARRAAAPPAGAARQRRAVDDAADGAHAGLLLGARRRRARPRPRRSIAPTRRSRAAFTPIATGWRSDEDRRMAQEIFESLAEAHRVLRDPARRRAYVAKLGRDERRRRPASRRTTRWSSRSPRRSAPPRRRPAARRALALRGRPRAPARAAPPRGRRGAPPGGAPGPQRGRLPRGAGVGAVPAGSRRRAGGAGGDRRAASRHPDRRAEPAARPSTWRRSTPRPASPRRPSRSWNACWRSIQAPWRSPRSCGGSAHADGRATLGPPTAIAVTKLSGTTAVFTDRPSKI